MKTIIATLASIALATLLANSVSVRAQSGAVDTTVATNLTWSATATPSDSLKTNAPPASGGKTNTPPTPPVNNLWGEWKVFVTVVDESYRIIEAENLNPGPVNPILVIIQCSADNKVWEDLNLDTDPYGGWYSSFGDCNFVTCIFYRAVVIYPR